MREKALDCLGSLNVEAQGVGGLWGGVHMEACLLVKDTPASPPPPCLARNLPGLGCGGGEGGGGGPQGRNTKCLLVVT